VSTNLDNSVRLVTPPVQHATQAAGRVDQLTLYVGQSGRFSIGRRRVSLTSQRPPVLGVHRPKLPSDVMNVKGYEISLGNVL
jgi:hypothetical protein